LQSSVGLTSTSINFAVMLFIRQHFNTTVHLFRKCCFYPFKNQQPILFSSKNGGVRLNVGKDKAMT